MYQFKTAMDDEVINVLYRDADLESKLNPDVFRMAMKGYSRVRPKNDSVISIIDFSMPSIEKRFYLIDLAAKKLLYHTYTSHG
ncbi:MAG: murein L,D-transpeptidase catalytic domain family protein, partial [Candidatus Marinimicrobia bacterium]|nr:murein L,D-transpeptidase catalytic domain family protein [Candidatus Neomarinimicrobiota bacterium]